MIEKYRSSGGDRGREIQGAGDNGEKTRRRKRGVSLETGPRGEGAGRPQPCPQGGQTFPGVGTQAGPLPLLLPFPSSDTAESAEAGRGPGASLSCVGLEQSLPSKEPHQTSSSRGRIYVHRSRLRIKQGWLWVLHAPLVVLVRRPEDPNHGVTERVGGAVMCPRIPPNPLPRRVGGGLNLEVAG